MKKWNEPKVYRLGVQNTNDDSNDVEPIAKDDNMHWCHVAGEDGTGGWVLNIECNHPKNNGHKQDGQPGHDWSQAHVDKCCCS